MSGTAGTISRDLNKLRDRGLTEPTAAGEEAVRVSVQCRRPLDEQSRHERRAVLGQWQEELHRQLAPFGGEVVPGSLSVSGRTVEALIPVRDLSRAEVALSAADTRLDLVVPRQVV